MKHPFKIHSEFKMTGDQPEAVSELVKGIERGDRYQTLLGVTGSGKTFTMANIIEKVQRPALVMAPNKTLAGQLCAEFKAFFPENRVEYFVSYYDYYQPEAYIASTDTYIEKDSAINDEIDRMRHSATESLLTRRDVIVVASVSCIYGLGSPEDYEKQMLHLRPGEKTEMGEVIKKLVDIQYERNDYQLKRGCFRVRGDVLDIIPVSQDMHITRVVFFDDEIEAVYDVDYMTGKITASRTYEQIYPASHYTTTNEKMIRARKAIEEELVSRTEELRSEGKILEAYRLEQRTLYDLEMLRETGFTKGIENYSRHLTGRKKGDPPFTLIDFFPDDYLLFIDESHVTVPQIGAMYNGDRSRKENLVNYGFRLPSALDNRPLRFEEFEKRMGQTVFVSATPGKYEKAHQSRAVSQIIRPTGLLDPEIAVHPVDGQIEDMISELNTVRERGERALILTLTKKMSEDMSEFLKDAGFSVAYLHSELGNDERLETLRRLRQGKYDAIVGINLLREGLDLPEVSLICILDADKQGFLRSVTSLIQIIGRAARNVRGKVILYADTVTSAIYEAVTETNRRRKLQSEYNEKHGIVPKSVKKEIRSALHTFAETDADILNEAVFEDDEYDGPAETQKKAAELRAKLKKLRPKALEKLLKDSEREMKKAAKLLNFEEAARLRDLIIEIKGIQ